MPFSLAALKNEIETDPLTYGYAAFYSAGNDTEVAAMLNKPRDGTDGEAAIAVRRSDIGGAEMLEAIDTRDFVTSTIPPSNLSWFESVTQQRTVRLLNDDGSNTRILRNVLDLIQSPSTFGTRSRLNSIATRVGSRAEQLFGTNYVVTPEQVGNCRGI